MSADKLFVFWIFANTIFLQEKTNLPNFYLHFTNIHAYNISAGSFDSNNKPFFQSTNKISVQKTWDITTEIVNSFFQWQFFFINTSSSARKRKWSSKIKYVRPPLDMPIRSAGHTGTTESTSILCLLVHCVIWCSSLNFA